MLSPIMVGNFEIIIISFIVDANNKMFCRTKLVANEFKGKNIPKPVLITNFCPRLSFSAN